MKTLSTYLLLGLVALTLTSCPDIGCLNPDPTYSFAVTARFTPEQDSIHVGDTLYLISKFPSTMVPIGGQEPIVYTNSTGIGTTLGIGEFSSNNTDVIDAVASFDYVNVDGFIYNAKDIPSPERVQQLKYKEVEGKYMLKVGLIPRKRGVFGLGIGNGLSNGRRTGDKCDKASFQITLSNSNPHLHFYKSWPGKPVEPVPNNGYWFKVY